MDIENAVNEYLSDCIARNFRPATLRSYSRTLRLFCKWAGPDAKVTKVTPSILKQYLAALCQRLHPTSVNTNRAILVAFCRWMEQEELIPAANWGRRVRKALVDKAEPRHMTAEECRRIVTAVEFMRVKPNLLLSKRDKAMLYMLLDTGMRRTEFCRLKLADVDLQARCINVDNTSKGRREREVCFGFVASSALQSYLRERRKYLKGRDVPHLWITRVRRCISPQELYDIVRRASDMAGLSNVRVHTFRHTNCTMLIDNGCHLSDAQQLLGHANVSTTQMYTHLRKDAIRKRYETACPSDNLAI